MKILVINCGSSSIKYQMFDILDTEFHLLAKGLVEKIGQKDSSLTHTPLGKDNVVIEENLPDHSAAMALVEKTLTNPEYGVIKDVSEIDGVGHRVVHGGEAFTDSALITEDVIKAIKERYDLAPLHNPPNVTGIEACIKSLGTDIPNVAVFDTAIHQTMPPKAYMYAIPVEIYKEHGVRKYGFHGTSHGYVAHKAAKLLDKPFEECKIITCHVGNGGSITAFDNGKVVDTSMGMTPLEGIIMGTRSGDIDPAVILYLMEKLEMNPQQINDLLNKKSGMLGLCGASDLRDVHKQSQEGDQDAKNALEAFNYRILKYIGAYVAVLNGVDAIVFTAGVGENDWIIRQEIIKSLSYLGIELDEERNKKNDLHLTTSDSKVQVYRIPTNEELVIAQETFKIIKPQLCPAK